MNSVKDIKVGSKVLYTNLYSLQTSTYVVYVVAQVLESRGNRHDGKLICGIQGDPGTILEWVTMKELTLVEVTDEKE